MTIEIVTQRCKKERMVKILSGRIAKMGYVLDVSAKNVWFNKACITCELNPEFSEFYRPIMEELCDAARYDYIISISVTLTEEEETDEYKEIMEQVYEELERLL